MTRYRMWLAILIAFAATPALALDPKLRIEQYRHTRWTIDEGAPTGIRAIAQTSDGYLWLGTATGLYRFDGIAFTRIVPADSDPLRSNQVTALLAASNGDLWVGYDFGGVGVLRGGQLRNANPWEPHGMVLRIVEDRAGAVWVGAASRRGTELSRFHRGRWTRIDAAWGLPTSDQFQSMVAARDGTLYVGEYMALLRLRPGARRFERLPGKADFAVSFAEDRAGRIWQGDDRGLRQILPDGRHGPALPLPGMGTAFVEREMLFDRDGNLWIAGQASGLARIAAPAMARGRPTPADLMVVGDEQRPVDTRASAVFADREGNLWVGSAGGLERYSPSSIVIEPLPEPLVSSLVVWRGNVYGATVRGLYRLGTSGAVRVTETSGIFGLCATDRGVLILSSLAVPTLWDGVSARAFPMPRLLGQRLPTTCASDQSGATWASVPGLGLYRLDATGWQRAAGPAGTEAGSFQMIRADHARGLIGYRPLRSLDRVTPGGVTTLWQGREIAVGFIKTLLLADGGFLLGGERGLARYDGQHFATLNADRYPWLSNVTGIQRAGDATWLIGAQGIARVSTAALDASFAAPGQALRHEPFGYDQGLRGRTGRYDTSDVTADGEGRLWFATNKGPVWIDPRHIVRNPSPPPVMVEGLVADGARHGGNAPISLPAGTRNLTISFAALSLTDPGHNQYRYRLDGLDQRWTDPKSLRQASYTNLGPGDYRFRIVAANADGVWNADGATLEFSIAPSFWQTWWFTLLIALAGAAAVWALASLRVRTLTAATRRRLEERLAERERIARELHDTLLQGFQGLMLRFQAVVEQLPQGSRARRSLESTLEHADDVLIEGRDSVRALRQASEPADLEQRIDMVAASSGLSVAITSIGTARRVCGPVADEIERIVGEALANVVRHARASQVFVSIAFGSRLEVRIADDGIGLPAEIRSAGRREGHFGLIGMRERAERLGGTIRFGAPAGGGTEIILEIPADVAYPPGADRNWRRRLIGRLQPSRARVAASSI